MTVTPSSLSPVALIEHARMIARADEQRHSMGAAGSALTHHSEDTLRGWGNAGLLDLEWSSCYTYSRTQHREYRTEYAQEYQRARAARLLARCG